MLFMCIIVFHHLPGDTLQLPYLTVGSQSPQYLWVAPAATRSHSVSIHWINYTERGRLISAWAHRPLTITVSYFEIVNCLYIWDCFMVCSIIKPDAPNCVSLATPTSHLSTRAWHAPRLWTNCMTSPALYIVYTRFILCLIISTAFYSRLSLSHLIFFYGIINHEISCKSQFYCLKVNSVWLPS